MQKKKSGRKPKVDGDKDMVAQYGSFLNYINSCQHLDGWGPVWVDKHGMHKVCMICAKEIVTPIDDKEP